MLIQRILSTKGGEVLTVASATSIADAIASLAEHRIGALVVSDDAARGFSPGDHASTFGGNPVVCAAACAVLDSIDEELLDHVRTVGGRLATGLAALPAVREVRGRGLMIGCELDRPAGPVAAACLEAGLVVGSAGADVLRLTPPLVVGEDEVDQALAIIGGALS